MKSLQSGIPLLPSDNGCAGTMHVVETNENRCSRIAPGVSQTHSTGTILCWPLHIIDQCFESYSRVESGKPGWMLARSYFVHHGMLLDTSKESMHAHPDRYEDQTD